MFPYLLHHPFKIPSYGFMLAVGILLGIHLAKREAKRREIPPAWIESLAFWVVLTCVLASRFLYTFVEHSDHYWAHPIEFFHFHKGGLAFSGSLIAAPITTWFFAKRKGLSFLTVLDILTPPLSLGLVFGKLGCFLAGCCHGKFCELPWAVTFNHPETLANPRGVPLHPTQVYEAVAWSALFLILYFFQKRKLPPGHVFAFFAILYGIGRFGLEYLRADPGHIARLTTAQFFSIPLILSGIWILATRRQRA